MAVDQGEPCLYRVTVRLLDDGVLDELSQVIGVRTVRGSVPRRRRGVLQRPARLPRGANWVPADVLPGRVTEADYARFSGGAGRRDQLPRVWGGGVREKRAFWDICDRLGIMAWQEFPLACAFLDHYPRDPAYLARWPRKRAAQCGAAQPSEPDRLVRRQRDQPATRAAAAGSNRAVLAEEDPGAAFIPASPSDGDVHQWKLWHGFAPWTIWREDPPFMSEFGLQALPNLATVSQMFSGDPPPL